MMIYTLPIHNQARIDRAENLLKLYITQGKELDEDQKKGLTVYVDALESMSDQINGYTLKDTIIQDMVIKEVSYFFEGTKSAEQVCEVLQNKVELYLNE